MKKIGILFGQEDTFPQAFIDRVNEKSAGEITAEFILLDKVLQGATVDYAVIVDRISQDVPFYRAWLKHAAINGAAVINNPFWWSADDKFVNNELALRTGVQVPRTALIPSRELPEHTSHESFRNLVYPFDWEAIFAHTGFPAYLKPYNGGGSRHVYKVHNRDEFFEQHGRTGRLVMMLQEEIAYEAYYRCYCIGGRQVRVIPYDPQRPHYLRYLPQDNADPALLGTIADQVARLNQYLGYDFNTVEVAVRHGVPYAIDFCNPAPDADLHSIGADNFEWVVETLATYAIERAMAQAPGTDNLTWGAFMQQAVHGGPTAIVPGKKKAVARKSTPKAAAPATAGAPAEKKPAAKRTKKKE